MLNQREPRRGSSPPSTQDRGCDPRARSPAQGGAVCCAIDGIVSEGHLRSPEKTYQDLMGWLERLSTGQVASVERPTPAFMLPEATSQGIDRMSRRDLRSPPHAARAVQAKGAVAPSAVRRKCVT